MLPPLWCLFVVLLAAAPARAYELQHSPEGGQIVRWSGDTVTYRISGGLEDKLGREAVRAAVDSAAATWAVGGNVPAIVISDWPAVPYGQREPGVQGIYWVEPADYVWEDGELAGTLTRFWGDGELISADIVINGARDYCFGCRDGFDFESVVRHELGHALGLDHSKVKGAIMKPGLRRGEVRPQELSLDDYDGVTAAYAHPFERDDWARMGCQAAPERHGRGGGWFVIVLLLFAFAWWRSRPG